MLGRERKSSGVSLAMLAPWATLPPIMIRCSGLLTLCFLLIAACGDDTPPADMAGDYTVAITSGSNGCNFVNWQEGATSTGIHLVVTQEVGASLASATVDGLSALFLDLLQGKHSFSGSISGSNILLEQFGIAEQVATGCKYTVNSTLNAQLSGDVLIGSLTFSPAANELPECAALMGCESVQSLNGTRPMTGVAPATP